MSTEDELRDRQRLTGDAILLERALGVLVRRYPATLLQNVEYATTRAILTNASLDLRHRALAGLPRAEAADRA